MRISLHIPTEQYGFVAVEYESDGEVVYDEAAREYQKFADAFKPQPVNALPKKDFDAHIDRMLSGENNHLEEFLKMSPQQQEVAQTIKRSIARLNYKITKINE